MGSSPKSTGNSGQMHALQRLFGSKALGADGEELVKTGAAAGAFAVALPRGLSANG
jgi:hypothetical protein